MPPPLRLEWIDADDGLRRWFADWLLASLNDLYPDALVLDVTVWRGGMIPPVRRLVCTEMEDALQAQADRLRELCSVDQITVLEDVARRYGLTTNRDQVVALLKYFLTHFGHLPENAKAFKASPWFNARALKERRTKKAFPDLLAKHYPDDVALQLALKVVMTELSAHEISRQASPSLGTLRRQRVLSAAVHRFVRLSGDPLAGPSGLASFMVTLLSARPWVPVGLPFDWETHFDSDRCAAIISGHLGKAQCASIKQARDLWRILRPLIFRESLRTALLRLAFDAAGRKKGWLHLRAALRAVFKHVGRQTSKQEHVTDLLLLHYTETRDQSPLRLAYSINAKLKIVPPEKFDAEPEGKSAIEVMVRRARKRLQRDHNLD